MTVHKKLMQARIKLQNTELKKTGENKFANYKYFELGDFLPQTMQIFYDLQLCSIVTFDVEYARLCIIDTEDGTTITITSPMAEANLKGAHAIQNLGAVESYQRRYLWLAAMEIVEHDMLDAPVPEPKLEPKPMPKPEPKPEPKVVDKVPLDQSDKVKVTSGIPGEWCITITEREDGDWATAIVDATELEMRLAKYSKDIDAIFKKNRVHYDRLKEETPTIYAEMLTKFKTAKAKLFQE
jgi:hypothetical protein